MGNDTKEDQRPWGFYTVLEDAPDHKIKRITVFPERRLSLQRHRRRSEHWHFLRGEGLVTLGRDNIAVQSGKSLDIPVGALHRIENTGKEKLVFIEIQTGEYFGEDDIERVEDDFGRV